jgi:hypothetical protein
MAARYLTPAVLNLLPPVTMKGQLLVMSARRVATASFDFRRMRNRQGWASGPQIEGEEDGDYLIFPRERLGNQYPLNYAINTHKITPSGNAYRNLHARGLVMLGEGKLDANKALVTAQQTGLPTEKFRTFQRGSEEFRQILRDVRIYFSSAPDIFVHDGDLGADRVAGLALRVFSDNANTALWCHHMLCPISQQDPRNWKPQITAYVLTNLTSPPFVALDADAGIVIFHNIDDFETIQAGLLSVAASFSPDFVMEGSHSLLLNASIFTPAPQQADLLLHSDKAPLPLPQLEASRFALWNSTGLTRIFNGYGESSPARTIAQALVAATARKAPVMFTALPHPTGNLLPHPTRTIFVEELNGQTGLASLTPPQALEVAKFKNPLLADVLKHRPTPAFVLNYSKSTTPEQIIEQLTGNKNPAPAPAAWVTKLSKSSS